MRFDRWARWRESVLFWLLLDPVEVARLCLCPPTVNTETLSKVYTKNKLASATSKLPDSTRLFMHPVHSPIWLFLAATALQGYFWFLCPAFSFFSQHNFTEKPAHQKFLTSSSFLCVCVLLFFRSLTYLWPHTRLQMTVHWHQTGRVTQRPFVWVQVATRKPPEPRL